MDLKFSFPVLHSWKLVHPNDLPPPTPVSSVLKINSPKAKLTISSDILYLPNDFCFYSFNVLKAGEHLKLTGLTSRGCERTLPLHIHSSCDITSHTLMKSSS